MPASQILALIVATSFAAGLNVYATVATLGLLDRAGAIELPAALDPIGRARLAYAERCDPTFRTYGPRTRREFLMLARMEAV